MAGKKLKTLTFKPGADLFKEGEAGTVAYVIRKGLVSVWRNEGGQRVHLAARCEGDVVGEMALLDNTTRSATCTAQDEVTVEVIDKATLDALLAESPETLRTILHQFFESLRAANDLIGMYASRPPGK